MLLGTHITSTSVMDCKDPLEKEKATHSSILAMTQDLGKRKERGI